MNKELRLGQKSIEELIDSQIKAEGLKPKPVKPIKSPVLAMGHTAIYRMHRYYARRPHNVFSYLIKHYTDPGDLILDPFCGGGVTVVESLRSRRRVVGVDINPLAAWISRIEVEPIDIDLFEILYHDWVYQFKKKVNKLFSSHCPKCKNAALVNWFEWSNVVICPFCNEEIILANAVKKKRGQFECTNKSCKATIEPNKCLSKPDKIILADMFCEKCKKTFKSDPLNADINKYENIVKKENNVIKKEGLDIPQDKFPDMDRARDDNVFGKGMEFFKDLMTVRQRISMALMKKYLPIDPNASSEVGALWHLFSSLLRYSNKFVFQSANWQSGKPVEWAGHNYWLPFHYLELNPIPYLDRRLKSFIAAKEEQRRFIGDFCKFPQSAKPWTELRSNATCWILNQSSHSIKLPDKSIDAIITDPPFGGNVQYGELSDFFLVWVKEYLGLTSLSDKKDEAIETRNQDFEGAKDRSFYENMLYQIFCECRRVIKEDGWLVLTFHNRDIGVWMSLHRAALRAGFRLPLESECDNRGMIYQPPVQNYTQTIHQRAAGSMLGDFILSFKPTNALPILDSIRPELTSEEEKGLQTKVEEIINYHCGADETTLMTGLIPYLHEKSLLHRLAHYDLKTLLFGGPFVFISKEKKWYTKDMVEDTGTVKIKEMIPAEIFVQDLVYSHLSEKKQATMDELLILIYSHLVNSHRPQISTIEKVLSKYCIRKKVKGESREVFIWKPNVKTPEQIKSELAKQTSLNLGHGFITDHNDLIFRIAEEAVNLGYCVHVGQTEQKKSEKLKNISQGLTGFEFGLPPDAFNLIKEIDLIIYKGRAIIAAVEVTTSISTFNKAVNDRFRNLLVLVPNLSIKLFVVISSHDLDKAKSELYSPANIKAEVSRKIKLCTIDEINKPEFIHSLI